MTSPPSGDHAIAILWPSPRTIHRPAIVPSHPLGYHAPPPSTIVRVRGDHAIATLWPAPRAIRHWRLPHCNPLAYPSEASLTTTVTSGVLCSRKLPRSGSVEVQKCRSAEDGWRKCSIMTTFLAVSGEPTGQLANRHHQWLDVQNSAIVAAAAACIHTWQPGRRRG